MSAFPDGGPAFPTEINTRRIDKSANLRSNMEGMSLRAYIATEAMGALLIANSRHVGPHTDAEAIAGAAVEHADALIAGLNDEGADDLTRDTDGNLTFRKDIAKGGTVRISYDHWLELQESAGYHVPPADADSGASAW